MENILYLVTHQPLLNLFYSCNVKNGRLKIYDGLRNGWKKPPIPVKDYQRIHYKQYQHQVINSLIDYHQELVYHYYFSIDLI